MCVCEREREKRGVFGGSGCGLCERLCLWGESKVGVDLWKLCGEETGHGGVQRRVGIRDTGGCGEETAWGCAEGGGYLGRGEGVGRGVGMGVSRGGWVSGEGGNDGCGPGSSHGGFGPPQMHKLTHV